MDPLGHDLARTGGLGIESGRYAATDDIAIRHHANQAIILADGDCADVVRAHQTGELIHARGGINPRDALMHCLFHFHGRLLFSAGPVVFKIVMSTQHGLERS
jgi:hypothetical protein